MSDLFKALLVDIGNTQIKYALVNDISNLSDVKYCQHSEDLISYISLTDQVIVSSVGHFN